MKQLAILVGLLLLTASAHPQSKSIHENVDPYTGLRTLFLEVGTRTCPGDPSPGLHDPDVHLLITALENPDRTVSYLLTPELDHAGYKLGLSASGTMDTLIDGVPGSFATQSGSTSTHYGGNRSWLHETIPFDLSQADLARLSHAQWVQFRINGQHEQVQRCTDSKHLRDLPEFLDAAAKYGPPQANTQHVEAAQPPRPFTEQVSASNHLKTLAFPNIPTQPCPGDAAPGAQIPEVRLTISAHQRTDGRVWYFLATDVYGGTYLNLARGGNIEVDVDGKLSTFHTINGSLRSYATNAAGESVPLETTAFHLHQPDLIAITKASGLELHISTPAGILHRCVQADQLTNLPAFLDLATRYEPSHIAAAAPPY